MKNLGQHAEAGTPIRESGEFIIPIDEQIAQLRAADWIPIRGRLWKAPVGGYFMGPHGAWLAMKRREQAKRAGGTTE